MWTIWSSLQKSFAFWLTFSSDRSLDIEYLRPMGDADEIMNMYDHIDNKDKTGNDELSLDYPFVGIPLNQCRTTPAEAPKERI